MLLNKLPLKAGHLWEMLIAKLYLSVKGVLEAVNTWC